MQLIYGAMTSFVFGGMGWWNDLGGYEKQEDRQQYKELSACLYDSMNLALVSGINSFTH